MPWLLLTDADLQFDLMELVDFLPLTTDADLVMGLRIDRQDPPHRRLNAAAWNWLVRQAFDVPVRDVDCEFVVKCMAGGARLEEHGVVHRPRVTGQSSGASPKVILRAFRELFVLRRQLRKQD